MAFVFADLKSECKRRATKNQGGSSFDPGIANIINTSRWRIAREARWRPLRRTASFNTVANYTTGTGAGTFTANSASITVTGATFLTDNIQVGRYITLSGSNLYYQIASITGETTLTLNQVYAGTTTAVGTYSILGQGEYTLPIQVGHSAFFWHTAYGYPILMNYVPTQEFYSYGGFETSQNVPFSYRMWGVNSVLEQPTSASVVTISSSSSADTSISVTVFGVVSGYPDYEIISTNASNGTTPVSGAKSFTSLERIASNQTRTGRITLSANSGGTTLGVLPVGLTTSGPSYTKIQLCELPTTVFPINAYYYKLPYQLVNDGDVCELGEEFSEAIILLSVCKLNAEQNKKEDADFFKLYKDEITSLKTTNVDKLDWAPKLQRPSAASGLFSGAGLQYRQVGYGGNYGPRWGY